MTIALALLTLDAAGTPAAAAGDARLHIAAPRDGQVYAPGDTVKITVSVTVPLGAGFVAVAAPGGGILTGSDYDGSTYHAQFAIPLTFSGPLAITPSGVDTSGNAIEGPSITIIVRATTEPASIRLVQSDFFLDAPGGSANLYATGVFPDRIERDLTTSSTGTTYRSSDGRVVAVDADGHLRATGWGTAVVIVKNGAAKAFADVWVEDPAHPLPPVDVTAQVRVDRSPAHLEAFDPYTSTFRQTLVVWNPGAIPLLGRLYVVVSDLPAKMVVTEAGRTKYVEPLGSLYYATKLPDGLTLRPGQSVAVEVRGWLPSGAKVNFTVRVFRSSAEI